MWDPQDNNEESIYPMHPDLRIGTEYRCTVECPPSYQNGTYDLMLVDENDFAGSDLAQKGKHERLGQATLEDGLLTAKFTPQATWPKRVRLGFISKSGAYGLGGRNIYNVV